MHAVCVVYSYLGIVHSSTDKYSNLHALFLSPCVTLQSMLEDFEALLSKTVSILTAVTASVNDAAARLQQIEAAAHEVNESVIRVFSEEPPAEPTFEDMLLTDASAVAERCDLSVIDFEPTSLQICVCSPPHRACRIVTVSILSNFVTRFPSQHETCPAGTEFLGACKARQRNQCLHATASGQDSNS